MEFVQYVYQKLNTVYPGKVVTGLKEGPIDDTIMIYEIGHNNTESKENARVGSTGRIQVTRHVAKMVDGIALYDNCITYLTADMTNVSMSQVTERVFTTFENGSYRIDVRIEMSR